MTVRKEQTAVAAFVGAVAIAVDVGVTAVIIVVVTVDVDALLLPPRP